MKNLDYPSRRADALYYPYARSFDRVMLKQAVLVFNQIWFYDPVELDRRRDYIFSLKGPIKTKIDQWNSILDDYAFLTEKGLINIFNPNAGQSTFDSYQGPIATLLAELVSLDLGDKEFAQLVSKLASRDHWEMSGERIKDIEFLNAIGSGLKAREARIRLGAKANVEWFDHHLVGHGTYGHHHSVSTSAGYSLNINRAILFSEAENLNLVTDDVTALRLLNLKYLRAKGKAKKVAGPSSIILKRTPAFFSKYNILALNLIKSLIPNEELDKRSFKELFKFKAANAESYYRFWDYLVELTSQVHEEPWSENFETEILNIIDTKVVPEATKLRDEMRSTYEKMFGSLIKNAVTTVSPTLVVSFFAGLTSGQILSVGSAALAGALAVTVPGIVDLWQQKRQSNRSSLSFLLKLT